MSENRLLTGILIILMVSVVSTGGLAVYLTLNHERMGNTSAEATSSTGAPSPANEPSAEQPEAASPPATQETGKVTGGPHIAFVSDREEDAVIYTINTEGSERQRISAPDLAASLFPSWSPNGQRVAYLGTEEPLFNADDVPVWAWISAADGSAHVQVSHAVSNTLFLQPTWSPDGTLLAFASPGETAEDDSVTIHIARSDGSGIERNITFPRPIEHMAWSPVKDELLIVSGNPHDGDRMIVHVMSSDGSKITEIFQGALTAAWSPHGESIAVGDYASQEILVIDLDQSDEEQTARSIAQTVMQPVELTWSPDGTHIAVATAGHYRQGYATVLHIVTLESGEITTVAEGDGWVGWPTWSPDGQRLAFTWGDLVRTPGLPPADLWVYDVASAQSEPKTTDAGFEGNGAWSP